MSRRCPSRPLHGRPRGPTSPGWPSERRTGRRAARTPAPPASRSSLRPCLPGCRLGLARSLPPRHAGPVAGGPTAARLLREAVLPPLGRRSVVRQPRVRELSIRPPPSSSHRLVRRKAWGHPAPAAVSQQLSRQQRRSPPIRLPLSVGFACGTVRPATAPRSSPGASCMRACLAVCSWPLMAAARAPASTYASMSGATAARPASGRETASPTSSFSVPPTRRLGSGFMTSGSRWRGALGRRSALLHSC